jgi:hypothetical protein
VPSTPYQIDYSAPPGKVSGQIDQIIAKLTKLDGVIDKTQAKLKTLGTDTPGLKSLMVMLAKVDVELKSKVSDAHKAETALKEVGKDNRAITALEARLQKLAATLATVTTNAGAATTGLAGVGSGGTVPAGGGRGGTSAAPAARSMGRRILGGAGAIAAFSAGHRALSAAGEAGKENVSLLSDSAAKLGEFRHQLREYASLRKHSGPDDEIVREATKFGKDSATLPEDISPFLTTYEGSATTGREKGNIGGMVGQNGYTPDQQDALEAKLKVVGAKFSTMTGLDAHTGGDLTGVVSMYARINSEADLAGELAGMHYGLDEGRGEISPLARSELGQAGLATGSKRVQNLSELGAFIGIASNVSKMPGSSGTSYNQMSRFLNESGLDNETQADFIKKSGMGDAKGDFNKLKALKAYVEKVNPPDVGKYLEAQGYGNTTDVRSVVGMMGNVDVLEKRIAKSEQVRMNGNAALARIAANQASAGTIDARAAASEFSSDIELGMTADKLVKGQTFARAQLKDPNQPGGQQYAANGGTVLGDIWRGVTGYFAGVSGQDQRVNEKAIKNLIEGGNAVNVDVPKQFPHLAENLYGKLQHAEQFAADYTSAVGMVEAAGGDPYGNSVAKKLDAAANLIKSAAKDAAQGNQRGGSAPPQMPGNGGAGFVPGRR